MTDQSLVTGARVDTAATRVSARTTSLTIPVTTLWRWQAAAALLLVALYLGTQAVKLFAGYPYFFGLVPMFDLDAEANLPSFWQELRELTK